MKPLERTIKKLIDDYRPFNIPYYQREYVWEGKNKKNNGSNFRKFLLDISNEYFESGQSQYFIGNLAFCKTNITEVVDGQQRLTTLVLFLSVLADNFCSVAKRAEHQKLVYNKSHDFIIQEQDYLTDELEYSLGYKTGTGTGKRIKLDETIAQTIDFIKRQFPKKSNTEWDGLYDYILNNISVILLEYTNQKDALRYFLNINSLSIELEPEDIFYTILSQALKIAHKTETIYDVKSNVEDIVNSFEKITIKDLMRVFLLAYYTGKGDKNMNEKELEALGVGKWLSYYQMEVYSDAIVALDFCNAFLQYLIDLKAILTFIQERTNPPQTNSPIHLSFALLKYERYGDLVEFLTKLFRYRHNMVNCNIYTTGTKTIDQAIIEDIAKRLNLTLISSYMTYNHQRLDGFYNNIKLDPKTSKPELSLNDIITNVCANIPSVFSLRYMTDPQSNPKPNIPDQSRLIKVVLAFMQGYLSFVGDGNYSLYQYIENCLSGNFTIEHLYSKNEYADPTRLRAWKTNKNRFNNSNEFDYERSNFENLSLLNQTANSSANDSAIYEKFNKYKNAHNIMSTGSEYLVQSLVLGSNFFSNPKIMALGLPNRSITAVVQNTWEHSGDNRNFIMQLIELAIKEMK